MKIAIITVNYNGPDDTIDFLESLKKLNTGGLETKTIVVDNGSHDNSVEKILKKFPKIDLLQTGVNKGFAGGYNYGLNYALAWGADYFLIVNNDVLIKDDELLKSLIKTAESNSQIGLVSPKILFAPGYEFHKDRYSKDEIGKVIWYGGGEFDWDNIYARHFGMDEVDQGQYNQVTEIGYTSGCCLLIKREVLDKVGLFDEKLFAYLEDYDLATRINQVGFKKYYDGSVSIYHKVSQTSGIGSPITDYFHSRNRLIIGFRYTKFRTKFALIREAIKFLLMGRSPQRQGVIDFFLGKTGGLPSVTKPLEHPQYQIKLSIVTVNYNTADLIDNLLKSIFHTDSGFNKELMEVIVLDNGRLDPSEKYVKKYPDVTYLVNEENLGFPGGFNRTIQISRGEYVLMLNSDMEVGENSLSQILDTAEKYKGEAVITGKMFFPSGEVQDSIFHLPTIWGAIKEYFFRVKGAYFMYLPKTEKTIQVEGAAMALYLIPQKILNKVGLLDKNIFIFFEDIEYARRLKRYNIPIYFDPKAIFYHHHGASTKKQGNEKSYQQLVKSSQYYHGKIYYWLLYYTLLFCQKFSGTKSPGEVR